MGEGEGEWANSRRIGEAVTGGLLARAVEPQAGEAGADGHTHERNCLNCGTPLIGDYCARLRPEGACPPHASGLHARLRRTACMHFEGKIWRTLPMLAWRPGELTRRYIAGERARFVSPVALFLFTVFLMFAVLNLTGTFDPISGEGGLQGRRRRSRSRPTRQRSPSWKSERKAAVATGKAVAEIDRKIAKRKEDIADSRKVLSGEAFTVE